MAQSWRVAAVFVAVLVTVARDGGAEETLSRENLLFHASFDESADADYARGDRRIRFSPDLERKSHRFGLISDAMALHATAGKYGGCLEFAKRTSEVLYFLGRDNVPFAQDGFEATVSLWLALTPDEDLPPGYVDPLLITDKKWNDAAVFLDFTDRSPRIFRLGLFADYGFWNPMDRPWDAIAEHERPMVSVARPMFSQQRWTHVALTLQNINRDEEATATLLVDGREQGAIRGKQRFSWQPENVAIMLGIAYVGRMDDLAIFRNALSAEQIKTLMELPRGVASLP